MPESPFALPWKGLVLAGGRSSRMGTDKASLVWRGETLLDRAACCLANVVGEENVLVSGEGKMPDAIADFRPGLGPIGGIASAALAKEMPITTWILVVPVDMPLLKGHDLKELVNGARSFPLVRAVHFEDLELPCAFLCDEQARNLLSDLCAPEVNSRMRSVSRLLKGLEAVCLPLPKMSSERFRNVNSPAEWRELG